MSNTTAAYQETSPQRGEDALTENGKRTIVETSPQRGEDA